MAREDNAGHEDEGPGLKTGLSTPAYVYATGPLLVYARALQEKVLVWEWMDKEVADGLCSSNVWFML